MSTSPNAPPRQPSDDRAVAARLSALWQGLAPRERRLVALAGTLVLLALLWTVAVQPAWRTLARAPAELERLDAELQRMQQLAAEARALRDTPAVPPGEAQAALRAATERLGPKAQLSATGERVVVRFSGVPPGALREWLAAARAGARARPVAVSLQRAEEGFSGSLELVLEGAPR
jgi:general secretion pathway protein M